MRLEEIVLSFSLRNRDPFTSLLFQKFENNLETVLNIDFDGLKALLDSCDEKSDKKYSVELDLKNAFREGGAPQLRWKMKGIIMNLHYIALCGKLERNATYEEWVTSMEAYKVGITRKDMPSYFLDGLDQFELGKNRAR